VRTPKDNLDLIEKLGQIVAMTLKKHQLVVTPSASQQVGSQIYRHLLAWQLIATDEPKEEPLVLEALPDVEK
jgi:hypothetical protein